MRKLILAATLLALATAPAAAYTSYLKPQTYWPEGRDVTVEGAFANTFFTPEIAVPADITGANPDGTPVVFERIAIEGASTRLHADLPIGGTYRITTGEQFGNVTTLVGVDGQWRQLAAGETAPADAPVTTLQTVTLAVTYITRGQPSRTVVDQPRGRLAIRPITHPNQVSAAEGLEVEVLFDGAPLANTAVVLYGEGAPDTDLDRYAVTDDAGRARFSFDAPGHYVIAARHRADMPPGSTAQVGSYTTTLTFEAYAQVPAGYDVAEREREAARETDRRNTRRLGRNRQF